MTEERYSKSNRSGIPYAVIITALKEECQAVTAHLSNLKEIEDPHKNIYDCGYFAGSGQEWTIAVAEIGVGNTQAAAKVANAVHYFNPEVLLFVGVAGGLKGEIPLGSVVASSKIYCYQAGKADDRFQIRPEVAYADSSLVERAKATARKPFWIQRIIKPQFPPDAPPEAHVQPIAAGDQVVSSTKSATFQLLQDYYSDAVAVDQFY
jgi:nucleoside phosphorylase